jgi:hypothetical protein
MITTKLLTGSTTTSPTPTSTFFPPSSSSKGPRPNQSLLDPLSTP